MKRWWDEQALIEHWTLFKSEEALFANRTDRGRIGTAVLLKFFQFNARFPRHHKDVPGPVLAFVGEQLSIPPTAWFDYDLKGRSSKRDREQIRAFLGFRPITVADEAQLWEWLGRERVAEDVDTRHLRSGVMDWCRDRRLEPSANDHTDRLIASAVHSFEESFFAEIVRQLPDGTRARLDALVDSDGAPEGADDVAETTPSAFSLLKSDPGRIGLASVEREVAKLGLIRELELPDGLWAQVSPKLLARYRTRAATESARDLRRHAAPVRYTLLSAFCWQRRREITDGLVELLIQIVHRISVRAEKRVTAEMVGELQRVEGKTELLFRIAEAALDNPDGVVREVLFPLVGESTLAALVKENQGGGPTFRRRIQTLIHRSYGHHYRRMLPLILATLVLQANNTVHRPLIEALDWLRVHREDRRTLLACAEVPIDGVVRPQLQEILVEDGPDGERINRIDYEICALQALRERLRCKEIWVEGADRYRNPDEDLPADFEANRFAYYQALHQPREPDRFIEDLQRAMRDALEAVNDHLPRNPKVRLRAAGKHRIIVTPLAPQPEPSHLRSLKAEVGRRWPMTSLLDVLKETDLRGGFTDAFKTLASREVMSRERLQQRLLLCLYGLGTNAGLKRMAASNRESSYADLLYVRRRFLEKSALREAIRQVVNATFAARLTHIWGEGATACASDSKKFGAWDQKSMTEWHIRYGGRGVMIYWHVERRAACIYSQLKRCSSSEVAAMIEGVLRHCTDLEVQKNYVDSHGQSSVLALHLLQASLVYVNTLMFQQVLEEPGWLERMMPEDMRGLSPLIYHHVNPYGTFELDMAKRLPIDITETL